MTTSQENEPSGQADVLANRKTKKWSRKEQLGRVLWATVKPLFALSPRPFWGWRRGLLRLFGARIGRNVHIYSSVRVTMPWNLTIEAEAAVGDRAILYALGPITIGMRVTISQGAHLCAGSHDYRDPTMPLIKSPITIGAGAWICAEAFVGPGVTVREGAILGARAVAFRDVPAATIAIGNPALTMKTRARSVRDEMEDEA